MTPDELRELTALLEKLATDPSPIFDLSEEERVRLLNAAGDLFNPDAESRRQYFRARKRAEKKARVARDESRRDETGIRVARARPVFTTPNVFPPALDAIEAADDDELEHELQELGQSLDLLA